jgi:diguanylate cyclase (GGDEF)-like protein
MSQAGFFRGWCRIALLSLLVPGALAAQTFPFEVHGLKEGLPQSQVTCVAQDSEGYIWAGTWGGLARFNGDRFTNYFVPDGLPSSRIHDLFVDKDRILWIATVAGLAFWQDHRLTAVADRAVNTVACRALAEDSQGHLWVGTDQGLVFRRDGLFIPVNDEGRPMRGIVYGIAAEGDGVLAVTDHGLFRASVAGRVSKLVGPDVSEGRMRAIARTPDELFIGTNEHGLFVQRGGRWLPVPETEIKARNIYRLSVGASGALYVASQDAGVFRRSPGQASFQEFSVDQGLPSTVANCAIEDRQGYLWIGTDIGGLARLRSMAVVNYTQSVGLPNSCVFSIGPTQQKGEVWFATLGGGVRCRVEGGFRVLETIGIRDGLTDNHIWKIIVTPQGEEWVLTDTAYHRRVPSQRRFERLPKTLAIPDQELYSLHLDGQGRVWVAGTGHAASLAVYDGAGWRSWSASEEGKLLRRCNVVASRNAGGVWVAVADRIVRSDGLTVHEMTDRPPLPAGIDIIALFEDRQGRLWAGNDGGLAVRETDGQWRLRSNEPGYSSSQVYFIGQDPVDTVWVGTSNGVFRFKPSGRIEPFGLEDGLAGLETNQDGFYASPDGTVWIGTVDGASRIELKRLKVSNVPPLLMVEAAELSGRVIKFPKSLDLSWQERTVTFRVAVLAYGGGHEALYRVRLEGMETEWLVLRRSGGLRYTNLTPESHRLLLQAASEEGNWGKVLSVPIEVRPPFWLTWWFRITVMLAAAAAAFGIFRWRTHLLRQRAGDLERTIEERTEELLLANEELERLATHDPLTGLWNQRIIMERLSAALHPPGDKPGERSLGLIIADLDGFKRVNDQLGHLAGDTALRDMAHLIAGLTRQSDSVGRYGGDEFLVILTEADRSAVESVVKRIAGVEYAAQGGNQTLTVTASCGAVAVSGEGPANEGQVLALADELLYQAKRAGKHGYMIRDLRLEKPGRG